MSSSHRMERIEGLIAQTLGNMILRGEIKDHRVSTLVSISEVTVARDLSHAKIGISGYLDDEELSQALEGLNSAAGYIQQRLGKSLQTRLTPRVHFHINRNVRSAFEMTQKIDEIRSHDAETGHTPAE